MFALVVANGRDSNSDVARREDESKDNSTQHWGCDIAKRGEHVVTQFNDMSMFWGVFYAPILEIIEYKLLS